jgi:hypothetical protein
MPETTQETPPITPAAPDAGQSFGDVANRLNDAEKQLGDAQAKVREQLDEKAKAVNPQLEAARKRGEELVAESSQRMGRLDTATGQVKQVQTQQPSRELHMFLAPVGNESPTKLVGEMITAIGVFAAGISGAARGDARAGLAALTGALKGWQEGDIERGNRAFDDWKAKMNAALESAENERRDYRDWFTNANLSLDQMFKGAELTALMHDNKGAADIFQAQNLTQTIQRLQQDRNHADSVAATTAKLEEAKRLHEANELQKQQENERKWIELAQRGEEARQRSLDRNAALAERAQYHQQYLQFAQMMKTMMLDTPMPGKRYWDTQAHDAREVSKMDLYDNAQAVKAGQPSRLTPLLPAQVQLLDRLAVAAPILDRLDQLIDKVNAVAPGQNITAGLLSKLKAKAGIDADIREIQAITTDSATEIAAALSNGTPRISILEMIRNEATPNLSMTADVAHRTTQAARTTITGRLQSITGDPKAYESLSAGLPKYGPSPLERGGKMTLRNAAGEERTGPADPNWKIGETRNGITRTQ